MSNYTKQMRAYTIKKCNYTIQIGNYKMQMRKDQILQRLACHRRRIVLLIDGKFAIK